MDVGSFLNVVDSHYNRRIVNLEDISWFVGGNVSVRVNGDVYSDVVQLCLHNVGSDTFLYVHMDMAGFEEYKRKYYQKFKLVDVSDFALL